MPPSATCRRIFPRPSNSISRACSSRSMRTSSARRAVNRWARSSATTSSTTRSRKFSFFRACRQLRRPHSPHSSRQQARACSASRITAILPVHATWKRYSRRWNMPNGVQCAKATIRASSRLLCRACSHACPMARKPIRSTNSSSTRRAAPRPVSCRIMTIAG